jgi:hypothetical protein
MPRGFTQANFDVLNERVRLLSLTPHRFLNSNVVAIGGVVNYVASVRAFRPKALQLHFFKGACPDIPNSLFELFFDVSPASVSIINSSRDPYVGADSENLDIADAPLSIEQLNIATNMAYCLGAMGISAENNNLPQLRQPRSSDISPTVFEGIKRVTLAGFRQGASAEVIDYGEPSDLGEPMAEEVVEEVVEETPVETSDARGSDDVVIELYQAPILQENAGYETISAKQLPISLLQFKQVITGSPTPSSSLEENTYDLLAVAEYLVQVGYSSDSVGKFFKKLSARGFVPTNIGIERRRFGTYLNMTIVRNSPLSGDVTASRFNSGTYKNGFLRLLERDGNRASIDTITSNRFKPVKFTGGGNTGRRLVGAVAIPILRSLNSQTYPNFVSIRPNVIDRYETAYQREIGYQAFTDSEEVVQETSEAIYTGERLTNFSNLPLSKFRLVGYSYARSGNLYNNLLPVFRGFEAFELEADKVYVFYFVQGREEEGNFVGYQLQWGKIEEQGSEALRDVLYHTMNLYEHGGYNRFASYLKNNDRLSNRGVINLHKLTDSETLTMLQSASNQGTRGTGRSSGFRATYRTDMGEAQIPLGVKRFEVLTNSKVNNIADRLEIQQEAQTQTTQQALDNTQLTDIQRKSFTTTFGIEIEGNFDEVSKQSVADLLTSSGFPTKSTHYHGSAPTGYFKLEDDSSVDNDMGGRGSTFEMVSPKLTGEQGLDKLSGVLAIIRSKGARTSPTAGTHIHFGYADYGDGESGFQKRKQLLVNYCVLQPFLLASQIAQSRNRGYARKVKATSQNIKRLVDSSSYSEMRRVWSDMGGGRGALHLKENTDMSPHSVPTYEFRFPASNFESDTITNMVRFLDKIWIASKEGYVPHSVESSKAKNAEEWLEDMLGQELYSFWKNRYRDLQSTDDYVRGSSRITDVVRDGQSVVSNRLIPKLNSW